MTAPALPAIGSPGLEIRRRLTDVDLGHPLGRPVDSDNLSAVAALNGLYRAVNAVDDPDQPPRQVAKTQARLRYGSDLEPGTVWLYQPDRTGEPIGALQIDLMDPPNDVLAFVGVNVHPAYRRRGHGTLLLAHGLRALPAAVRTVIAGGRHTAAMAGFLERHRFRLGSTDVPHIQHLDQISWADMDGLEAESAAASAGYELQRLTAPTSPELLLELVAVAAAIDDAPASGDLTQTEFAHDVAQLQRVEAATLGRGDQQYRVIARHRSTGVIAGHTVVTVDPDNPTADQNDTAVLPDHRGHRLGLAMKINMLHWLTDTHPTLRQIVTTMDANNTPMIEINHALGYSPGPPNASYELAR
jgi:RimJ/RimL family protein N-acetyltransferase